MRKTYTYASDGTRLSVETKWNPSPAASAVAGSAVTAANLKSTKKTDYVGNKVYENGSLKRILVDGGYYEMSGKKYYFFVTDHLGSTRIVGDAAGGVIQTNQYDPFDLQLAERPTAEQDKQPYKYTAQELDRDQGLNLYDYHARQYDPAIGRFTTMDPLAEKYYSISPYVYCANNPVNNTDLTGKDILIGGALKQESFKLLQQAAGSDITLSMDDAGYISYQNNVDNDLSFRANHIKTMIDDQSITVRLIGREGNRTSSGELFIGGAFMGNEFRVSSDGSIHVIANQEINPIVLNTADTHTGTPGSLLLHEATEAYEGAKLSREQGKPSPKSNIRGSVYQDAHNKAFPQTRVEEYLYNKEGQRTVNLNEAVRAEYIVFDYKNKPKIIQKLE